MRRLARYVAGAAAVAAAAREDVASPPKRELTRAQWVKFPKVGSGFARTIIAYACGVSVDVTTESGIETPAACDFERARRVLAPLSFIKRGPHEGKIIKWLEFPARYQSGALKPTHRIVALFRDPRQRRRSEFLYYVRRRDPGGFFPKDLAKQLSWFVLDEKRPLEERWKFYLALMKPYAGCMTNLLLGRFCVSAGRPNATASAQAVALVESELEFVGLQSEWARTVCLFHATYGGVVFPNEALLPHGGIARDTTALDNVRPHPFEDPDRALFAAAADRFRRDVDSRRRDVEDCEVRLKTTARRERCSDTPPRPERWTRSNATRPCTVYAAAHMWTHCSSKRWITKNICHRTCTALGLPRELTCDGVARVTNFSTVPGGAPHTTCTGATPRAPGPSGEVWRPCEVGVDFTNAGGARRRSCPGVAGVTAAGACTERLGWLQVSHTPWKMEKHATMGGNPEHVLWLYAAERSDVWYDAGKSLVVSDTLDLYRFLGSKIPPGPMNQPYKVQQLRLAKQTLKKQGYDSIVLTDHVDGCERCWARDRRTVEIVSLGAFRPKCPCSSRFQRTAPGADWRRHAIRAHGVPMIPKGGERYSAAESAVLRGCDCANATASPWGRAVIC